MNSKKWIPQNVYINEIIRVTYKCNWKCKFCNVLKTNNFWEHDVLSKDIIYQILNLSKKYSTDQRNSLILSFSWWEPTLDKNLSNYIKLAKKIWIWNTQIQTNWTFLFKNKEYILDLIESWLDQIFLAQHSFVDDINKSLWIYYNINDFKEWVTYVKENELIKKIQISFNIVINKINIYSIYDYIEFLNQIGFLNLLPIENNNGFINTKRISFWLVQPNWYAEINKEEVLLKFDYNEKKEIIKIIEICKKNNIYPDFHFTAPPLCILDYPEYNLEYQRLKDIQNDEKKWNINKWNYASYKHLWKEKKKFDQCEQCKYNKYCLWFYNNWIDYVWNDYVINKINKFIGVKSLR